jgi:2-methylcitrate dehydratase PrpD
MPAQSRAQQRAAGAALSAKRGETAPEDLQGAARSMFDSMTEGELEALAATKLEGLPEHVEEERRPAPGD